MPVRILHTADNHIGLPFKQYPEQVRAQLVAERFAALVRLVETANERQADFFVVAGDLFDSIRVPVRDIRQTAQILRGFSGEAVIVVPGNHDHSTGPETEVWRRFRQEIEGAGNVDLLTSPEVKTYELEGQQVHFFPCPCPSKTGQEALIGWVAEAARAAPAGLRIGIAHGNVTGLGLDAEGRYFNMEPVALESAGVATWLLGHIHVPFPGAAGGERSAYFMAGTHTPDSLRCSHGGTAWWIECEGDQVARYERLLPGRVRFMRLERDLVSGDDIQSLDRDCAAYDAPSTVLDLQLTGRLSAAERDALDAAIDRMRPRFLALSEERDIHDRIDAAQLAARYRTGGLAHRLLTALLDDAEHPDAATLAHELIQEVGRP